MKRDGWIERGDTAAAGGELYKEWKKDTTAGGGVCFFAAEILLVRDSLMKRGNTAVAATLVDADAGMFDGTTRYCCCSWDGCKDTADAGGLD